MNEAHDLLELAASYVNSTCRHIFLTGKAGTGKTTFLRSLPQRTHKSYLVVAPTGIAALNAGGVTIHSQFQLPFGTFLPVRDGKSEPELPGFFNAYTLSRKHPLNRARRQVLQHIELLVIDEVSMLRADLLDAIDHRLRAARNNYRQPFGGVQLLLIGDLFQLPPIVKDQEWYTLQAYYNSMHFFESHGLRQDGYVYIELQKIYRQQDDEFIRLLNHLRENTCTLEDLDLLNRHHQPGAPRQDGVITLCTHNYQADRINQEALTELPEKTVAFAAEISGDFPESMYPLPPSLELKTGAQVMFVKNDTVEKRYFNGKLAIVSRLTEDGVWVIPEGEKEELEVQQNIWENKRYVVSEETKDLEEETIGTFTQYPLKLAWAITVHKSQGLTFDRAMIDIGQAFAPGQAYVALSRLRSLDGLILRTRLHAGAISSDGAVVRFASSQEDADMLSQRLRAEQAAYLSRLLLQTFDFQGLVNLLDRVMQKEATGMVFADPAMQTALDRLRAKLVGESENCLKFQRQILRLHQAADADGLKERVEKGAAYYRHFLYDCLYDLMLHLSEVRLFARTRTYADALAEVESALLNQIAEVQKAGLLTRCILNGDDIPPVDEAKKERKAMRADFQQRIDQWIAENPKTGMNKTGKVKAAAPEITQKKEKTPLPKPVKGATVAHTLALIKEGKSLEEVAQARNLALSTVQGHAAKAIEDHELDIFDLLPKHTVVAGVEYLRDLLPAEVSVNEMREYFGDAYTYGELKMVKAFFETIKEDGSLWE